MLKLFFLTRQHTALADEQSQILESLEQYFRNKKVVNLDCEIETADALVIQMDCSYKNFRFIERLKSDPIFKKYAHKIFSINIDDYGTGLVKGLYTCLPKRRFNPKVHAVVPYFSLNNELILQKESKSNPEYLATWRGNTKSNGLRNKIVNLFSNDEDFDLHKTNSWFNHSADEKQTYKNSLLNAKFSLCPAGWAAVTFRIYESMALGKCPVIIADEFVPPPGPDWASFSIIISEKKIKNLKKELEKKESSFEQLGEKAYQAWEDFFAPEKMYEYFSRQLIELIETSRPTTVEAEFRRWTSFSMFYSNNWTLPQRVLNKIDKLAVYYGQLALNTLYDTELKLSTRLTQLLYRKRLIKNI